MIGWKIPCWLAGFPHNKIFYFQTFECDRRCANSVVTYQSVRRTCKHPIHVREGKANWKSASLWLSACLWGGRTLLNSTVNPSLIVALPAELLSTSSPKPPPNPFCLVTKGCSLFSGNDSFSGFDFLQFQKKLISRTRQLSDFTSLMAESTHIHCLL